MMMTKLAVGLASFCCLAALWLMFSYVSTPCIGSSEPPSANKIMGSCRSKASSPEFVEETITTKATNDTLRIQIASDLHIEFYEAYEDGVPEDIIIPKAPVLALLGDVGLAFTPQLRSFLHEQASRFETVLYIAGNHEYYNHGKGARKTVDEQEQWMEDVCSEVDNLHYMEKKSMMIHGVNILATTLWSYIPPSVETLAGSSMNDYQLSYMQQNEETGGPGVRKLSANDTRQWHQKSVQWLQNEMNTAKKHKKPTLVLTHHTPSLQGTSNPQYDGNKLSHCFSTNLTDLVQHPAVRAWACGHTHWNFDIHILKNDQGRGSRKGTRLLSNQRGYPQKQNSLFDNEGIVLEVSSQWRG